VTQAGVGTNRYAYAANDPVNLSDPGGNLTEDEAVILSDEAYKGDPNVPDYIKHLERRQDDTIGFSADVYFNTETGEIIVSVRGTDDLKDINNGWGLIGSPQHKMARDFFEEVAAAHPDAKFSVTGHSMGGGLALSGAAAVGNRNGGDTIVVNSMGYAGYVPEDTINIVSAVPRQAGIRDARPMVRAPLDNLVTVDPLSRSPAGLRAGQTKVDVSGITIPAGVSQFNWNHSIRRIREALELR